MTAGAEASEVTTLSAHLPVEHEVLKLFEIWSYVKPLRYRRFMAVCAGVLMEGNS